MLVNQTIPVEVQHFSYVNTCFVMLVNQINPVGVQPFSYVTTYFCHVGVPNKSWLS